MVKTYTSLIGFKNTSFKNKKTINTGVTSSGSKRSIESYLIGLFAMYCILFTGFSANAQIPVTVSGTAVTSPALSGSYSSLSDALTALNAISSYPTPGTIVFTCAGGNSETAPVKGFVLGSATLNPLLSATNTVTIINSGGTVTINAGVGTANGPSATPDGMLYLNGADYVTIDGLTFIDGNTTNATVAMEFGIALFKRTAGDGCNNNTIQNCTFNMQRINNASGSAPMLDGSWAIEVLNSTAAAANTQLTPTNGGTLDTNGTNSNNKFYANATDNGNGGIGFGGFAATVGVGPTPNAATFLGDLGNDVGGTSISTGNVIVNFGGGATTSPSAAIRANNQWSINIQYNTIDNSDGSGVNHATTLRGIYAQAGISANATISNNSITLQSGATTSALTAIENVIGSTAAANTININNNTIRLAYTTATTGVMAAIVNTSTAANVNINNNDIQGIDSTVYPSTGTINLIAGGSPAGPLNITGNTISNFVMTGASGTFRGINGGTPTGLYTISGNLIENFSYKTAGSTGSLTGIYNLASATLMNVNNNIVRNFSTPGTGTLNGIQNNTVAGTFQCKNNQIYNFSTTGGGAGGFSANGITWSNTTCDLSNNIIYGINSTGSTGGTGGTINGITHSGAATVNGNVVYDLSSNSTNAVINGIVTAATGTNTVTNNLIGDLRAPFSTGNIAISGMLVSGGTTNNIYHNTVNVASGSSSATTFGTSAIYFSSSTPVNNLRNNVFVNTSDPGPTGGFAAAIRYTIAPTSTNFPATNNNNLYYAGSPSANKVIYCEGSSAAPTNSQLTIGAYKTYINNTLPVSGRESSSVSEAPNFVSTTGSNPITNFLKYDTTIGTQIEQGGVLGTGITSDYSGTTVRCPGGGCPGAAAAPDMGAWELNGISLDLSSPVISAITAIGNTCGLTSRSITATISDASNIATGGNAPRIYFRKNAGTYVSAAGSLTSGTVASGTWTFTITYAAVGGVATADVIEYFIVAQDVLGNVGGNPSSGIVVSDVNTVTTPTTTPLTYSIQNSLGGTYTVGAAGNYATLTAAAAAYNTSCMSAPVVFSLIDASYSASETFPIVFNANVDASAVNTLTIRPAASNTATITGAVAAGSILKLNGADYVIIDGSNNGGTSRDLTISNTTATSSGNAVVWLSSPATGNGATNNTVKNTIIEGNSSTTSFIGLFIGGNATITLTAAGLERNNNNTVTNCLFRKTQYGLATFGFAAPSPDQNLVISNNNFGTATVGEGLNIAGIHADRADNLLINGNEIQNVRGTSTTAMYGMRLLDFKSGICTNNKVHDIAYTGTATTARVYGIGVASSTYTTVENPSLALIANNFVYAINSSGTSTTWNTTGILASVGYGDRYYHNTVDMSGQLSNTASGLSAAFANGNPTVTGICNNIDVRNNIFNVSGSTLGGNVWAYYTQATNFTGATENYNLLRAASTGGATNNTGRFNGVNYATLALWQAATGISANDIDVTPIFVSATDLHLNMGVTFTQIESGGTTVGIATDIDGQLRPGPAGSVNGGAFAPDLGADEFDGVPPPVMIYDSSTTEQITGNAYVNVPNQAIIRVKVVTTGLLNPIALTSLTLNANGTTAISDINATPARVYFTGSSTTFSTATLFGSATPTIADFNVTGSQVLATGDNYFWLAYDVAAGATPGNFIDAQAASLIVNAVSYTPTVTAPAGNKIISGPLAGVYTVGTGGNYPSLTNAGGAFEEINIAGASANVTFNIISDLTGELGTNALNEVTGGFSVLIKPSGAPRTITGSTSGALIRLNGADGVTIDGSLGSTANTVCPLSVASRDLTINNTNTGTSSAVVWLQTGSNGATNNTVKNCNLTGNGVTQTLFGVGSGSSAISITSLGTGNNNNSFVNNNISGTQYGIYSQGASAESKNTGTTINQNVITTSPNMKGGIWVGFEDSVMISGNSVSNIAQTTSPDVFGITLGMGTAVSATTSAGSEVTNATVTNNVIGSVVNSGTFSAVGIAVASAISGTTIVANNMISGVAANGTAGDIAAGIIIGGGAGSSTNVYHNTVSMQGTIAGATAATQTSTCLAVTNLSAPTLDLRNNIFSNTQIGNASATLRFATIALRYNSFTTLISNNNDLYCAGAGPGTYQIGITGTVVGGTNSTTLLNWQTTTAQDGASQNILPVFTTSTDLHLPPVSNIALNDLGTPLASVTNDIDCDTRSGSTPDMGADEFSVANCITAVGGTVAGSITNCGPITSPSITASGYSSGLGTTYQWMSSTNTVNYPNAGTPVGGQTDPAALTTGLVSVTTYYWLQVSCATNSSTAYSSNYVTITIQGPAPTIASGAGTFCETTSIAATGGAGGTIYFQGTTSNGTSIVLGGSPQTITTSGTYYFRSFDGTCWGAEGSVAVIVVPNPTGVTATASVSDACNGVPFDLFSTPALSPSTILQQNFETGLAPWNAVNTSSTTGTGNPALVIWAEQTSPYIYSAVTYTAPQGTKFAMANADAGGSGITSFTTLTSPGFSTLGYTTLTLSFQHYYRHLTNAAAFVEVSTNGTVWTTVQSYNATQGTPAAFASASVNLDAYVGNANLYVRFRHSGGWEWYWAVDDVAISGTPVPYTYEWTSVPAGFTSSLQNPTGVTQSVPRTYKVKVTGTGGCFTESTVAVGQAGCSSIVNLKLFVEGYYLGGGLMTTVQNNQDFPDYLLPLNTNVENITVELRDPVTTALVASTTTMLKTDGTAVCTFPTAPSGSFYIAVKTRTTVQTWSKLPQAVGALPLSYDFTTAASQSYDDNQAALGGGVFGFYSGDIDSNGAQDGEINAGDYSEWEADSNAFLFGSYATDLNGDGEINAGDYSVWETNANGFVFALYPIAP